MTSMHEKQVQLEQMGLKELGNKFITVFGFRSCHLIKNGNCGVFCLALGFRVAKNRIDVVYLIDYPISPSFTFMQIMSHKVKSKTSHHVPNFHFWSENSNKKWSELYIYFCDSLC